MAEETSWKSSLDRLLDTELELKGYETLEHLLDSPSNRFPHESAVTDEEAYFDILGFSPAETDNSRASIDSPNSIPEQDDEMRWEVDETDCLKPREQLTCGGVSDTSDIFLVGLDGVLSSLKIVSPPVEKISEARPEPALVYLSSDLETRLIMLYFLTVHTLCPVVDKEYFCNWQTPGRPVIQSLTTLRVRCMFFAAFQHLGVSELRGSPFTSIIEGQHCLFNEARRLYEALDTKQHEGAVELVQAAILLSHWSPYDCSQDVNSFWVDKAFHHAVIGKLDAGAERHHRIMWWCCLVRNRTISLALRRPHKLKRNLRPCPMLHLADLLPARMAARRRGGIVEANTASQVGAHAFVHMCRLSVIMEQTLLLRHESQRWDTWRGRDRTVDMLRELDQALETHTRQFQATLARFNLRRLLRQQKVSFRVLRIIGL
ncbi:uncharacterized protein Z518_04612 [Rhinocladiella mackenziei CBS 650.93]|uniref:Rhinocladiella mackenziei CBS 650.93 unplaced genomic scaffold supercont1.3, whole genome shotgun sequence n=1 Tax=Rhinocladiella mackenziei CBS 650.93 TaxID=1442369 RepID=A0A0D2ITY4_9EURO|nr:uncharacterized protein Z518_04612 [Rhinocladiella mackenziei CBS 650.93]KIX06636.1 hypothetical protein Z518_04612 [Rhinocladiella mackenziei CBS 650.93]